MPEHVSNARPGGAMTGHSLFDAGPVTIFLPLFWAMLAVCIVLWIALPFGVFGVKKRLDRIIGLLENQRQGALTKRRFRRTVGNPWKRNV